MQKSKSADKEESANISPRQNSVPLQIFLIIALIVIVIYFLSTRDNNPAISAPPATYTQPPTYTPLPTNTPRPTYTHLPTHAPLASNTPRPTYTPLPTDTPRPTYTHLPTHAPLATNTPRPTYTRLPTYTPFPTATSTDTPSPTSTETSTPTYTPSATSTPTPTPIPPRIIIEHIQPKGQLVVISMELARADIHIGVEDGRCSHGADFVAQGVIEAGIEIGEIDEDDITFDRSTDSYTLRLPAPGLTSCRIEYIRQYGNSVSLCNPDWDQVRILAEHVALNSFVDNVLERGIIERTADQAEVVLGSFVSSITGKPVDIAIEDLDEVPEHPSSCQPGVPRGYDYNESTNEWEKTD